MTRPAWRFLVVVFFIPQVMRKNSRGSVLIDKVEGPGRVRGTQTVQRSSRSSAASGTGFVKHLEGPSESEAALATGDVSNLGAISQIAGLQEVDDALSRRKRSRARAQELLDRLEQIRVALLTGSIGKDQLLHLAQLVNSRRADAGDPRLGELLDDIELRVRVELAKLGF